jgi:hypothetical protein
MIVSAKVIGSDIGYDVYSRQSAKRGDADFSMSRSELSNFAINPKRWLDGYKEETEDTWATTFGSLVESLAGLNGDFESRYAVSPAEYSVKQMKCPSCGSVTDSKSCRKCGCEREEIEVKKPWNSNASECEKWEESQGDRQIVKSDLRAKAQLAVDALRANADVSELFDCSKKQVMVSGFWRDKATDIDIPIRCLLDLVPNATSVKYGQLCGDFKTARNGNPELWPKVCESSGYDIQAALSLDLYTAATKEDRQGWIMPIAENIHPYHVVTPLPALSMEFLEYGRIKYQNALTYYARCLSENKWPSYPTANRLVFGGLQFIGPESLWSYREQTCHFLLLD